MSIKIKVSYTDDEELTRIIQLLTPLVKSWKKQPAKGKYKRAYTERTTNEARANHERGAER